MRQFIQKKSGKQHKNRQKKFVKNEICYDIIDV